MNTVRNTETNAHLSESRRELRSLLIMARDANAGHIPRSRTMRLLTDRRIAMVMAIGVGGLLLLQPRWIERVLRVAPVSSIVRILAVRAFKRLSNPVESKLDASRLL